MHTPAVLFQVWILYQQNRNISTDFDYYVLILLWFCRCRFCCWREGVARPEVAKSGGALAILALCNSSYGKAGVIYLFWGGIVKRIRQRSTDDLSTEPVDDRSEVHISLIHFDTGDIDKSDLVLEGYCLVVPQIRHNCLPEAALGRI